MATLHAVNTYGFLTAIAVPKTSARPSTNYGPRPPQPPSPLAGERGAASARRACVRAYRHRDLDVDVHLKAQLLLARQAPVLRCRRCRRRRGRRALRGRGRGGRGAASARARRWGEGGGGRTDEHHAEAAKRAPVRFSSAQRPHTSVAFAAIFAFGACLAPTPRVRVDATAAVPIAVLGCRLHARLSACHAAAARRPRHADKPATQYAAIRAP